jgi:anti-sigma B factor antagonist
VSDFSVLTRRDERGRTVVAPRGELDLATNQQFVQAVSDALLEGRVDLVVDLTDTSFMDSTSLGTLISARRRSHALGGSFVIVCNDPRLLRLFEVTSLDKVFAIERDTDAGVSSDQASSASTS